MTNEFLNAKKNITCSKLRGLDLQEYLATILNNPISYRPSLNIPGHLTFGVEIEFEKTPIIRISKFIKKNIPNWRVTTDGSLTSGGEVVSPILKDTKKDWENLKEICLYLKNNKADTTQKAGGHIHIGSNIFESNPTYFLNFIKLWICYENILIRFLYGDKSYGRKVLEHYAESISLHWQNILNKIDKLEYKELIHRFKNYERYQAVNLQNMQVKENLVVKNTVEFRCPNATVEEAIWQNNVNTLMKLLLACQNSDLDKEKIEAMLKIKNTPGKNYWLYNEIYLLQSLEFADMIFQNNLDKSYFLRQYLKDINLDFRNMDAKLSKKFVKK